MTMRVMTAATALLAALASYAAAEPEQSRQTPAQLCKYGGDDSARKGGIATLEAFKKKYAATFKSADEEKLAWSVYQAVNRCDAVVAIGRLDDTGGLLGKSGYCVLRDLKPWTIAI